MTPLITAAIKLLLSGVRKGGGGGGGGRPEKSDWEKHNEWNKKDLASGGHAQRVRDANSRTPRFTSPTANNFLNRYTPRN